MPSAFSVILAIVAGIIGVAATAIYVFGIPPAMKRQLEEKALETMGENKASYIMKGSPCVVLLAPLRVE